jgi:uncharacterized protein YndB with AHSA1/START domain
VRRGGDDEVPRDDDGAGADLADAGDDDVAERLVVEEARLGDGPGAPCRADTPCGAGAGRYRSYEREGADGCGEQRGDDDSMRDGVGVAATGGRVKGVDGIDPLPYSKALPISNASGGAGMPDVVRSLEIKAPPSTVWRWLATEEALRRWLSPSLEIDLQPGGSYRLLGADEETWVSGTVLEIVPEGSLVLSWMEEGAEWIHPARLVISLAPTPAGTLVSLVHDGLAGIGTARWQETRQAYERGADRHEILEALAELVTAAGA